MESTQAKVARLQKAIASAQAFLAAGGDLKSQAAEPLSLELIDASDELVEELSRCASKACAPTESVSA